MPVIQPPIYLPCKIHILCFPATHLFRWILPRKAIKKKNYPKRIDSQIGNRLFWKSDILSSCHYLQLLFVQNPEKDQTPHLVLPARQVSIMTKKLLIEVWFWVSMQFFTFVDSVSSKMFDSVHIFCSLKNSVYREWFHLKNLLNIRRNCAVPELFWSRVYPD